MRRVALSVVLVLAVSAAIYPYNQSGQVSLIECRQEFQLCTQACDANLQAALNALAPELLRIEIQRVQETTRCGPPIDDAARACIAEANARAAAAVARVKDPANAAHFRCVTGCKNQNSSCLNPKFHGDIDLACIGSGATCFKLVSETCAVISDVCSDCGISLCGGGEWKFDSEVPLTVTLLASTSDLSNPRVIAASTPAGNQALLNVPSEIKLNDKEQLYLQFSSKAKPKGKVRVRLRRDK